VRIVSYSDFKRPDGSIDWGAFHREDVAAKKLDTNDGVYCSHCGAYIGGPVGYPQVCNQCQSLTHVSELIHSRLVRCPHCAQEIRPSEANASGRSGLFEPGLHEVVCVCAYHFTVETHVSYSFVSPALLKDPDV